MTNKLKNNLEYVFCAALGFLNFILLAFPFVSAFYEYDLGSWGGVQSSSDGVSGYQILRLWDGGFGGVMSSLVQLVILLGGIAIMVWGACALLKEYGILPQFPDRLGNFESKKLSEFALFGMAGLHVLLLVFLIIFTASNTESAYGASAGFRLSAGIFISLVFYIGSVVALIMLKKKMPANTSGESITYVCSNCGKRAKASDKFCNACGGNVEKKVIVPVEYVCEKCGTKASAKDKFCRSCGGAVVQRQQKQAEAPKQTSQAQ